MLRIGVRCSFSGERTVSASARHVQSKSLTGLNAICDGSGAGVSRSRSRACLSASISILTGVLEANQRGGNATALPFRLACGGGMT